MCFHQRKREGNSRQYGDKTEKDLRVNLFKITDSSCMTSITIYISSVLVILLSTYVVLLSLSYQACYPPYVNNDDMFTLFLNEVMI